MDLINHSGVLKRALRRCIAKYDSVSFATAWASAGNQVFDDIHKASGKVRKAVIGTHFFQTDPEALEAFIGSLRVRTRLQPSGVFHPKIYLFWSGRDWEAFVGSANLTNGALSRNAEVVAHITSSDAPSTFFEKIEATIAGYFADGTPITRSIVEDYRLAWALRRSARDSLSGDHNAIVARKSPLQSRLMRLDWPDYYRLVIEHGQLPEERIDLLNRAHQAFHDTPFFADQPLSVRYMIAGLDTDIVKDPHAFGRMGGNGRFYRAVKDADPDISAALDEIPLVGLVSRSDYDRYLACYSRSPAFPNGGNGIATVTRLLALKRPDQFVCLDKPNLRGLCRSFGIPQAGINYDQYWEQIIERIRLTPWWNSAPPRSGVERGIWNGRAAFLDSIFYLNAPDL